MPRLANRAGLHGAAFAVIDELFSRRRLPRWIGQGSPAHHPAIADDAGEDRVSLASA